MFCFSKEQVRPFPPSVFHWPGSFQCGISFPALVVLNSPCSSETLVTTLLDSWRCLHYKSRLPKFHQQTHQHGSSAISMTSYQYLQFFYIAIPLSQQAGERGILGQQSTLSIARENCTTENSGLNSPMLTRLSTARSYALFPVLHTIGNLPETSSPKLSPHSPEMTSPPTPERK